MKFGYFFIALLLASQTHAHAEGITAREISVCAPITIESILPELHFTVEEEDDLKVYDTFAAAALSNSIKKPPLEWQNFKGEKFPVYSKAKIRFFRGATISQDIDKKITEDGWKSGYDRGIRGNALPPDAPLEDRIIEFVGVKPKYGKGAPFPRDASVVGVLEDPFVTLKVLWHTSWTNDPTKYVRIDELEIGPGAKDENCANVKMMDATKVFESRGLTPRFSTEGEWEVDREVPSNCIVATYRLHFGDFDTPH